MSNLKGFDNEPVKGYCHIKTDEFVAEEDAYEYALEKCMGEENEEFRKELVEWFFSGNWVKEERKC